MIPVDIINYPAASVKEQEDRPAVDKGFGLVGREIDPNRDQLSVIAYGAVDFSAFL